MKAARLHEYHQQLRLDEIGEPGIVEPHDVIVRVGGAGLCRTDLHIQEGQWAEKSGVRLPYTLGHENAGWVHEVGSAVEIVKPGDTVIVHPLITCGLCRACRAGDDVHCANNLFPGISVDGGFAELLKTTARSIVKLEPTLHPRDIAALADAGLTAYHAVKKAAPTLYPGTRALVIGAGGLVTVDGKHVDTVLEMTDGKGVEAVLDFVGERGAIEDGVAMLRDAGSYYVIGYGENINVPTIEIISREINFIGNLVGSYNDLEELMTLTAQGKVSLHTSIYALDAVNDAMADLDQGRLHGRGILVADGV
jgi:NAD+-dependent secondary alcohol dehydrogenase Adh1